ncbi:MAG: DUF2283 domain-containing protein [Candidatus Woesearchaeota archaeon]|jgi:uncharacterized protein YuzE|nr:DUF2283 domain-containing protein [Candidatus Woesearchaeota archaeon]|tara:strand:+ start:780 stop:986 length:207 start_codon:yes stop_codon:yes gene_type:complete
MKLRYDPEADAMYLKFKEDSVALTKEIDPNTLLDFNEGGEIIGVEILFVNERNPALIKELKAKKVLLA